MKKVFLLKFIFFVACFLKKKFKNIDFVPCKLIKLILIVIIYMFMLASTYTVVPFTNNESFRRHFLNKLRNF